MVNLLTKTNKKITEFQKEIQDNIKFSSFDNLSRTLYSTDASIYQIMPKCVIFPEHIEEILAVVEICKKHNVSILARGSGTSLAGQAVGDGAILDLKRFFNQIKEINPEEKYVIAQPGAILGDINSLASEHGLIFGPDPASSNRATVGGIIGNNSTGAHFIEYGMTSDNIESLNAILGTGEKITFAGKLHQWDELKTLSGREGEIYSKLFEILNKYSKEISERYPNTKRNASGYALNLLNLQDSPNLSKLFTGSEGTLGIVTEAKLRLVDEPKYKWLTVIQFNDLTDALKSVPNLLESNCSAIELMDSILIRNARNNSIFQKIGGFFSGDPDAILLVESTGNLLNEIKSKQQKLEKIANKLPISDDMISIKDNQVQENIWKIRSQGLGILMSNPGDAKPIPFIEDVSVPVEYLADYVGDIQKVCNESGIEEVAIYAHASSGCLHVRPNINLKTDAGQMQMREIANETFEIVSKYNGANSGEHGDGLVRSEFLQKMYGKKIVEAFKEVKEVFDPDYLFNPGKIVNPPKMDDTNILRFFSDQSDILEIDTLQDFSPHQDLSAAIGMCNGSGECLNLSSGGMCPSYKVTRDELNSTRGRANALRTFLSGYYRDNKLEEEHIFEVLELCLSCQACKIECPSSVDMAKIKAEFLHSYYSSHRPSIRTIFFANIDRISRFAQKMSGLSNWTLNNFSIIICRILNIEETRKLPKFAKVTLSNWFKKNETVEPNKKKVVFFSDTSTEYHKTEIGKQALLVLKHLGYQPIIVEKQACCGRAAYSKGFLDRAKKLAQKNIKLLKPFAEAGIPIVGVEPSCLSMFVNEYLSLLPGKDSQLIASKIKMVEEFILEEILEHEIKLEFDKKERSIVYHGHCQQKANFGTEKVIRLLELIPNLEIITPETGCCGMAGSFGYEKEHHKISIQIGENSLGEFLKNDESTIKCASGTSCRDQIIFLSDEEVKHTIEIFADALEIRD